MPSTLIDDDGSHVAKSCCDIESIARFASTAMPVDSVQPSSKSYEAGTRTWMMASRGDDIGTRIADRFRCI